MKRLMGTRSLAPLIVSVGAVVVLASGTSNASVKSSDAKVRVKVATLTIGSGPISKTFAFIGRGGSRTTTLFNLDTLLVNARCDTGGNPVVFAFTSATNGDIFGRMFDGFGRLHIIKNSAFTKRSRGVNLAPIVNGDYNSSGTVMFENSSGKSVTVNYAFDNRTTLNHLQVCTVWGSVVAT